MSTRIPTTVVYVMVGILFIAGGCATHVPVSETVMFHDGTTLPTHTNQSGFGVTGTMAASVAAVEAVVPETRSERDVQRPDPINGRQAGGGFFVAGYDREGHLAVSGTLGFPMTGVDATLQIQGRNYLTVGASLPALGQAFLQHRVFNSPRFGAAVGVGGRHTEYSWEGSTVLGIDSERVASLGARLFGLVREQGHTEGGIKFGTYIGYAPRLDRPVVSVTLTVGQF